MNGKEHNGEDGREDERLPVEPRRDRLGRNGYRERDRNEEGDAEAQPSGIDADRPATGLEDPFEELRARDHMRTTQNAHVAITSQKQ